jgi:hypothetical protein
MAEKISFPKIPESNWWSLRAQFLKSLPSAVTPTYLRSLLNLTSEKSAANLLPPLRQMGFIDADNKLTPRANEWRNDSKYNEVCAAIVNEVYPQELCDLFSGPDVDKNSCKNWFMHSAAIGEGAASQIAAMYVLLTTPLESISTDSRIPKTTVPKAKRSESVKPTVVSRTIQSKPKIEGDVVQNSLPMTPAKSTETLRPSVHIDLQIHISPEADAEQIDNIFSSIAKHLYDK